MQVRRFISIVAALSLVALGQLHAATSLPFQFRDGMIWVQVSAAGHSESLHFLLDSGAGATVIDLTTARHLGLKLGAAQSVQEVSGRTTAYRINDFAAEVGGQRVASTLFALDLSGPSSACHQKIDGLIGLDFIREHIVQIDYAAQTLRLLQRSELAQVHGEKLPLARRNDAFCTRVSVDGRPADWVRLDTGCNSALEWVVTAGTAGKFGRPTIGLNSSSVREIQTAVRLGSIEIPGVKTGLHARPMFAGEAGLLGNGLLSRFTVTIDGAQGTCVLSRR